ncbi:MAG: membrane protein insertion efficiency factor YidD, partial [Synergistota bacterium]|nr:membrane protein insertion efficiency factor YidD [Synergistota bacterium]
MKTGRIASPAAFAVILLLKGYQLMISPWLGRNCRFYPTCSSYAVESLRAFGLLRGGSLA